MADDPLSRGDDLLARMDYSLMVSQMEQNHREQIEALLRSFVEIKDSLDRILSAESESDQSDESKANLGKKVGLLNRQFEKTLVEAGVERIVCVGNLAEPGIHEIVGTDQAEQKEDTILREELPGYRWESDTLRKPRVVVSRGPGSTTNN